MFYETESFQELVEIMASCERLGLLYVVQKDFVETEKGFGFMRKTKVQTVYKLQVVQYVEEVEDNEEVSHRGQSESEEAPAE
jgi:hypothetical protein